MDLTAFRAALGDIPVQDHPKIVQQKSRDHYWYSPRLKAELENVTAQLVVTPRTQDEAWSWARTVGADPAAICGFDYKATIAAGAPADLVLFRARNWTELLSRPQSDRVVLRNGVAIDTALPDYRELDDLMEA